MAKFMSRIEYLKKIEEQNRRHAMQEQAERLKNKRHQPVNEDTAIYNNMMGSKRTALNEGTRFRNDLKKSLLSECIYNVYSKSIPQHMTESLTAKNINLEQVERSIVNTFIEEQGVGKLLREFKHKNIMLAEMAFLVEDTFNEACDACDKTKSAYILPGEVKDTFFDKIATAEPDDVIDSIKSRITNAMNSFLSENEAMKNKVKEICASANEKINASKSDQLKESWQRQAKRAINEYGEKTPITLLGEMIKQTAKSILKNDAMREQYTTESNTLDMDSIVESAFIMYAFMETVNTMDLVKMTPEYIQKKIDEI